ncbi:MAG: hypothetical protein KIT87_08665 [Anaerolineae bacterium]|nr:hypothetical protein [Anaerolineae bacterium]
MLVGQRVVHSVLKDGTVAAIRGTASGEIRIIVRFDKDLSDTALKSFTPAALSEYFVELTLPPLEGFDVFQAKYLEQQRQKEAREQAVAEFATLKIKYHAARYADSSPLSPLCRILLQLDSGERLTPDDIDWLEKEHLNGVLGHFYEQEAERTGDRWNLVKAGSNWRKAKDPHRALHVTDSVMIFDAKLNSALLTVRGGAMRDLKHLREAERLAFLAIDTNPASHYAYSLLGALCFQTGRPGEGDRYCQKAEELGASAHQSNADIEEAIRRSEKAERKRTAEYLIKKDPHRYHWAKRYLS